VRGLRKYFPIRGGVFSRVVANVKAVEDVSFDVKRGEVVGLVGESGSGKTTAGRAILRLIEPTAGEVIFDGVDIAKLPKSKMREYRKEMQIIFQDPFASLNPRMSVGDIIGEALTIHNLARGKAKEARVADLLERVGMNAGHMRRYPHEFSGGQRQRIGIARALAVDPKFIVADEPVSALDVSIQAQVVNLLQDLQEELGLTMLFIAHDLGVVEYISDRCRRDVPGPHHGDRAGQGALRTPRHPYTEALLSAVPIPDPTIKRERVILQGDIPSPINPPSGCVFRTRCPIAIEDCKGRRPRHAARAPRRPRPRRFYALLRDYPARGGKRLRGRFVSRPAPPTAATPPGADARRRARAVPELGPGPRRHRGRQRGAARRPRPAPAGGRSDRPQRGRRHARLHVAGAARPARRRALRRRRHPRRVRADHPPHRRGPAPRPRLGRPGPVRRRRGRLPADGDAQDLLVHRDRSRCGWGPSPPGARPTPPSSAHGARLGAAFQIRDDVLNLDPAAATGKEFAGDLYEGKRTLVLAHLFAHATPDEAPRPRRASRSRAR
jgi:peptide/nickel transport system ATP-binding protein